MAEFIYKAKDLQGNDHIGSVQSPDAHSAVSILQKKGLIIISLNSKNPFANKFLSRFIDRVGFTELVIITRQLATMVSSGLVLSEALDILEEQQTNKTLKKALADISENVKGGLTLSQSLSKYPDIFPRLYINLVKSGEASGKLDSVLLQMADGLEKDREFQSKIKGAMIYPAVALTMMIVVMIIMMVFVIPKLTSLYAQSSIDLPLPTKILIGSSNLFTQFWWLLLIFLIGIIIGFNRW